MKTLSTFLVCLLAASAFGAALTEQAFRGTGGVVVSSNLITHIVTIDGSSISSPTGGVSAATATNIAQAISQANDVTTSNALRTALSISTNGNQFGSALPLTLKNGPQVTNASLWTPTNQGSIAIADYIGDNKNPFIITNRDNAGDTAGQIVLGNDGTLTKIYATIDLGNSNVVFTGKVTDQSLLVSNNVGIGTYVPTHKFHVVSGSNDVAGFDSTGTDSASMLHIANTGVQGPFFDFWGASGRWAWGVASAGTLQLRSSATNTDPVNGTTILTAGSDGSLTTTGLVTAKVFLPSAATASRAAVIAADGTLTNASGTPTGSKFLRDDNTYATPPGGSATPGGAFPMLQFNENGSFSGTTNLTWDQTNSVLSLLGTFSMTTLNAGAVTASNITTGSKLAMWDAQKILTNSAYAETDFALAASTNGFVKTVNGTATGLTATGAVLYGSALATNWTQTDVNGWHNTNSGTLGHVDIQSGNVTASSNIITGDLGQFKGNAAGLTNFPTAAQPGQVQSAVVSTNVATNAVWFASMNNDSTIAVTNTLGGSASTLFLTNVVDRKFFVFRVLADGTARTITVSNVFGGTVNVINTNGFSGVGTIPTVSVTASKLATICGRAWTIAGATNVDLWASVQQ